MSTYPYCLSRLHGDEEVSHYLRSDLVSLLSNNSLPLAYTNYTIHNSTPLQSALFHSSISTDSSCTVSWLNTLHSQSTSCQISKPHIVSNLHNKTAFFLSCVCTGSADRSVRVWDTKSKKAQAFYFRGTQLISTSNICKHTHTHTHTSRGTKESINH